MTGGKNMSRENRWWTVISGASRFINDIVDAVRDGNSVIIKNSGSIPFYDDMLNNIYHQVGSDMYDRTIKSFDHSRICSGSLEEYLSKYPFNHLKQFIDFIDDNVKSNQEGRDYKENRGKMQGT